MSLMIYEGLIQYLTSVLQYVHPEKHLLILTWTIDLKFAERPIAVNSNYFLQNEVYGQIFMIMFKIIKHIFICNIPYLVLENGVISGIYLFSY
ncbi:hypothetical protein BpHYR1_020616 [Brachionus plicatilis]|uniref:Uncharacterized protein n=1 Tax=Brachionus plicatilis TaxID=10195 RepID=A0A3M7PQK6_BRAPC|nr:hypothetical protein BpHYR1_020616 [Brachionus plicatilis]